MFQIRSADGDMIAFASSQFRANRVKNHLLEVQEIESINPQPLKTSEFERLNKSLVAKYDKQVEPEKKSEVRFIHEIMSSPVFTVTESTTIKEAQEIFANKRFRYIPVVSKLSKLTGIISDRNVLNYYVNQKKKNTTDDKTIISEIMVKEVLIASPDALIRDAARIMIEERIGALPIIDPKDNLIGMLTRSDILRALIIHGPLKIWA